MNTEAIELPDYQPQELSPLDEATLHAQGETTFNETAEKAFHPSISEQKDIAYRNGFNKGRKAGILMASCSFFVIKDIELYVTEKDTTTATIEAAKLFDNPDAAERYLERKRENALVSLLMPSVKEVIVSTYWSRIYEEK